MPKGWRGWNRVCGRSSSSLPTLYIFSAVSGIIGVLISPLVLFVEAASLFLAISWFASLIHLLYDTLIYDDTVRGETDVKDKVD